MQVTISKGEKGKGEKCNYWNLDGTNTDSKYSSSVFFGADVDE